jgi:RES domain-containing protein
VSSLRVWRLCSAKYAESAYSGEGAKLYGGRWSPPGVPLVYTSESRALCLVEVLANVEDVDVLFDVSWVLVGAELAATLVERPQRYPATWRQFPHSTECQAFGADWAQSLRTAALRVPSAVVPGEFNYLLNPAHPDFKHVKVSAAEPFNFDARLA